MLIVRIHTRPESRPYASVARTSSSWNSREVQQLRESHFYSEFPAEPESADHAAFHLSTFPQGSEYSVCMTRQRSRTVSLSRIELHQGGLTFTYQNREESGEFAMPQIAEIEVR